MLVFLPVVDSTGIPLEFLFSSLANVVVLVTLVGDVLLLAAEVVLVVAGDVNTVKGFTLDVVLLEKDG